MNDPYRPNANPETASPVLTVGEPRPWSEGRGMCHRGRMPDVEMISRVAHTTIRAYCEACGDPPLPLWSETSEEMKESTRIGVRAIITGEASTPEMQHDVWLRTRADQGWTYGPEKDKAKLTHPNMVPYSDLPVAQRIKDELFRAVVMVFLPDNAD